MTDYSHIQVHCFLARTRPPPLQTLTQQINNSTTTQSIEAKMGGKRKSRPRNLKNASNEKNKQVSKPQSSVQAHCLSFTRHAHTQTAGREPSAPEKPTKAQHIQWLAKSFSGFCAHKILSDPGLVRSSLPYQPKIASMKLGFGVLMFFYIEHSTP